MCSFLVLSPVKVNVNHGAFARLRYCSSFYVRACCYSCRVTSHKMYVLLHLLFYVDWFIVELIHIVISAEVGRAQRGL